MGRIEWNGMEWGWAVELACSHGRRRSYSVLDLLCGVCSFISVFFIFCAV